MDALSHVLSTVRMTAAIFYDAEFTAPWGFRAPPAQQVAPVLAPDVEHIMIYHLLTEGRAVARLESGGPDLPLAAGDIVMIPHGDPYTVSNGSPATLRDGAASLGKFLAGDLSTTHYGGGGESTRFVCGYFGCERHACRLFLAGLPPLAAGSGYLSAPLVSEVAVEETKRIAVDAVTRPLQPDEYAELKDVSLRAIANGSFVRVRVVSANRGELAKEAKADALYLGMQTVDDLVTIGVDPENISVEYATPVVNELDIGSYLQVDLIKQSLWSASLQ
jgi:hypothetical protein